MRISRFMLVGALICFSLLLTGCTKTWSVDFTRVADIDDWYYNGRWNQDPKRRRRAAEYMEMAA